MIRLRKVLVGCFKNVIKNWKRALEPGVKTLAVSNLVNFHICEKKREGVMDELYIFFLRIYLRK